MSTHAYFTAADVIFYCSLTGAVAVALGVLLPWVIRASLRQKQEEHDREPRYEKYTDIDSGFSAVVWSWCSGGKWLAQVKGFMPNSMTEYPSMASQTREFAIGRAYEHARLHYIGLQEKTVAATEPSKENA